MRISKCAYPQKNILHGAKSFIRSTAKAKPLIWFKRENQAIHTVTSPRLIQIICSFYTVQFTLIIVYNQPISHCF